jgi:hypothetical protein
MPAYAKLFIRRNGAFGSSCDGVADTGHHIAEDSGLFTVYSIHDPDKVIAKDVTGFEAEKAIARDWREEV